jgi:hypothetical protein
MELACWPKPRRKRWSIYFTDPGIRFIGKIPERFQTWAGHMRPLRLPIWFGRQPSGPHPGLRKLPVFSKVIDLLAGFGLRSEE